MGPGSMGLRFQTDFLRQLGGISTKYLSYAHIVMVLEGDINEMAVGLLTSKKILPHIVKICGSICGSRSKFLSQKHAYICMYIMYIHRYTPHPYRQPCMCCTQFWKFPDNPPSPHPFQSPEIHTHIHNFCIDLQKK